LSPAAALDSRAFFSKETRAGKGAGISRGHRTAEDNQQGADHCPG